LSPPFFFRAIKSSPLVTLPNDPVRSFSYLPHSFLTRAEYSPFVKMIRWVVPLFSRAFPKFPGHPSTRPGVSQQARPPLPFLCKPVQLNPPQSLPFFEYVCPRPLYPLPGFPWKFVFVPTLIFTTSIVFSFWLFAPWFSAMKGITFPRDECGEALCVFPLSDCYLSSALLRSGFFLD